MEILFLNEVDSTHTFLKKLIKKNGYTKPISIATQYQTKGIGSRDNSWEGKEKNLFFSFVIDKTLLPLDLPIQSYSIYFSYILKKILVEDGSVVWLKWPNDFYIEYKKIGGTITNISENLIYCGIGLNLNYISDQYGYLDINIDYEKLLNKYFTELENKISWKHIFSKYLIEFENSKQYKTTIDSKKVSLSNAVLNDDGSISINNKKVFSLR